MAAKALFAAWFIMMRFLGLGLSHWIVYHPVNTSGMGRGSSCVEARCRSGVKMNRQYLYGTEFTVMTDHIALPSLYNTTRPTPHRVERHRGRLGSFQFKVQHVPGKQMPCDYGSRHPDALPSNLT